MRKVENRRLPYRGLRAPYKRYRQKSGTVSRAWKWAVDATDRKRANWRIGSRELMVCTVQDFLIKRNATSRSGTAIPYALYKWRVFGFDCYRGTKRALTINKYLQGEAR